MRSCLRATIKKPNASCLRISFEYPNVCHTSFLLWCSYSTPVHSPWVLCSGEEDVTVVLCAPQSDSPSSEIGQARTPHHQPSVHMDQSLCADIGKSIMKPVRGGIAFFKTTICWISVSQAFQFLITCRIKRSNTGWWEGLRTTVITAKKQSPNKFFAAGGWLPCVQRTKLRTICNHYLKESTYSVC